MKNCSLCEGEMGGHEMWPNEPCNECGSEVGSLEEVEELLDSAPE